MLRGWLATALLCACTFKGDGLGDDAAELGANDDEPTATAGDGSDSAAPPTSGGTLGDDNGPSVSESATTTTSGPGGSTSQMCQLGTWFFDSDGDGYGDDSTAVSECNMPAPGWVSQGEDCNDQNGAVNPGASEVCDSADNDCDGKTDELSAMFEACNGCAVFSTGLGAVYSLCTANRDWDEAQLHCESFGANLASIHAPGVNLAIQGALALGQSTRAWIGLNDPGGVAVEGTFTWTDGSAVDYTEWDTGEPNNNGDQDCVVILSSDGDWQDVECLSNLDSICADPAP